MDDTKTLGKVAFEAYSGTRNWKDVRGDPIPVWSELKQEIRDAWEVAATAVAKELNVRGLI